MIRNLIVKELREHWLAFSALAALSLLGLFFNVLSAAITAEAGNALVPLRAFLILFGTLIAMITCSRLVVREYQGKTQLFLEALPLTRGRMIAVKYTLGFAMIIGVAAIAYASVLPIVAHRQGISLRFVEIVATRGCAFLFFLYSFFFVTGMLGRYRVAIYLVIALGILVLSETTQLDMRQFGPIVMVDHTFPFERDVFPSGPLQWTLGLGAVFTIMAFTLALVREGSAAAMLAEKMSHREKLFVTALLIGIVFAGSIFERKTPKQPFELPDAIYRNGRQVTVSLAAAESDRKKAETLATRVHEELAALVEYLDLDHPPTVFIATRRDLDANRYELGELKNGEGLLVRVNLSSESFDEDRFVVWLIREFLISGTNGRAKLEPKMWVLDGIGPFWVTRNRAHTSLTSERQLALRAIYGVFDQQYWNSLDLRKWLTFRDIAGEGIAAGVAWSGLDVLSRHQGPERTRNFLRSVLSSRVPSDGRALWYEYRNSMEAQLKEHAGIPLPQFMQVWREQLELAGMELNRDLAALPRVRGEISFKPLSSVSRTVSYQVDVHPSPVFRKGKGRLTLLHADLHGLNVEVEPSALSRDEVDIASGNSHDLPGTRSRGDRFYWTLSLEVPELGCEVISGWIRQEVD